MTAWPYPAPDDDGGAAHLGAGTVVPDVSLPATSEGDISLAKVQGLGVVFIYPWSGRAGVPNPAGWDDIPGAHGSTVEAEGFRDHHAAFRARGVHVFGLSTQSRDWQREFARQLNLDFPLLSDENMHFADALKLPRFEAGGVTFLKRLTLLFWNGQVVRVIYPVHPPGRHAQDVLELL